MFGSEEKLAVNNILLIPLLLNITFFRYRPVFARQNYLPWFILLSLRFFALDIVNNLPFISCNIIRFKNGSFLFRFTSSHKWWSGLLNSFQSIRVTPKHRDNSYIHSSPNCELDCDISSNRCIVMCEFASTLWPRFCRQLWLVFQNVHYLWMLLRQNFEAT